MCFSKSSSLVWWFRHLLQMKIFLLCGQVGWKWYLMMNFLDQFQEWSVTTLTHLMKTRKIKYKTQQFTTVTATCHRGHKNTKPRNWWGEWSNEWARTRWPFQLRNGVGGEPGWNFEARWNFEAQWKTTMAKFKVQAIRIKQCWCQAIWRIIAAIIRQNMQGHNF